MKNVRKVFLLVATLTPLSLLGACSGGFSAAPYAFDVGINPNPLNFFVSADIDTGILTISTQTHSLTFASKAGAVGATVEGYDIEFFEASDNPAFPGDYVQRSSGSLSIYVPPGIVCDELREPDAERAFDYCTANSAGAAFARGPERTTESNSFIPVDIAREIYQLVGVGGAVGAYANIYFYGTDDLQRPFRSEKPYQIALQVTPVGEN